MSSYQTTTNCTSAAIPFPSVFGVQFLSVEAAIVENYTYLAAFRGNSNHGFVPNDPVSFCNVTVSHKHSGKNTTLHTQIWLPLGSSWNERLQMTGGGGWVAGLDQLAFATMYGAISEGYVTSGIDGGVPTDDFTSAKDWALTSPGNVDYNRLQDFATIALHDGALVTKSVTESFYGRSASFSYWSGCSQGGRQGHMFAQRYPDIFDGIAAAAPAINWAQFFAGQTFPQQVLNEIGEYPHPCEYTTLTRAVIEACDGNDGLIDGLISHPDSCSFDPYQLVGTPANCNSPGGPATISEAAASAMNAAWHGVRTTNGSFLWHSVGYEAEVTNVLLATTCANDGPCEAQRFTLFTDWIKFFVEKDPSFDLNNMSREDYVKAFYTGIREYDSIIGTGSPDLSEFRAAGGKMLTYHGTADEYIPFRGSRQYYEMVTRLDPNVHDFYRLFEAPGIQHCFGGPGGQPTGAFSALVNWVENDVVPESLVGTNPSNETNLICPYPKKAIFKGQSLKPKAEDFVCVDVTNDRLD